MKIKLDPDGVSGDSAISKRNIASAEPQDFSRDALRAAGAKNLEVLVAGAMAGTLPLDRPLEADEPRKLSPLHLNMVFDRANGLKGQEIAEKYDIHPVYANRVLRHPYSQAILHQMMGMTADKMTEPAERLRGYAHEMIDTKIQILRTTESDKLRNHIASDILDRAGFGARTQVDVNSVHRFALPAAQASQIAAALREADEVQDVDYEVFVESSSKEGLSQESETVHSLPAGTEHSTEVAVPPGSASPELERRSEAA